MNVKVTAQDPQFRLRMSADLKDWLTRKAVENHRSINAEITFRLEQQMRAEQRQADGLPGKSQR